jgi:hypothetical protein
MYLKIPIKLHRQRTELSGICDSQDRVSNFIQRHRSESYQFRPSWRIIVTMSHISSEIRSLLKSAQIVKYFTFHTSSNTARRQMRKDPESTLATENYVSVCYAHLVSEVQQLLNISLFCLSLVELEHGEPDTIAAPADRRQDTLGNRLIGMFFQCYLTTGIKR